MFVFPVKYHLGQIPFVQNSREPVLVTEPICNWEETIITTVILLTFSRTIFFI